MLTAHSPCTRCWERYKDKEDGLSLLKSYRLQAHSLHLCLYTQVWGEGERGRIETVTLTCIYTTMCKTDRLWEAAVYHSELNLVFCDDLDRGMRDGREAQEGENICVFVGD